jgi:hypothetical protein
MKKNEFLSFFCVHACLPIVFQFSLLAYYVKKGIICLPLFVARKQVGLPTV